ncbi:hypothetical protein [Arthrobacter sp. 4R501]|uniref:hypothetical protein n=1 Tax=Arthrobacter sp. 4R501 TaxID=2058886 RepID=UPI0028006E5F|nr:hypothetical protein [Arthrobacter sp. 4R501]
MLGYYFRFYEGIFGRPCFAIHDPLAAALAVGGIKATVAPVVHAAVDTWWRSCCGSLKVRRRDLPRVRRSPEISADFSATTIQQVRVGAKITP